MEAGMQKTEDVVARALAVVAASKALRERQDRQRREIYGRIEIAIMKKPTLPKGTQLPLNLQ
jgi:hypothetical protein